MLYIACFLWGGLCASLIQNKAISFPLVVSGAILLTHLEKSVL